MDYLKEMQSYQPETFYTVVEMQEILKADATSSTQEEKDYKEVIANNFLQTLSDFGADRWEEILGTKSTSIVLDERRSFIVSKLRGLQKLSATRIKEIAQAYQNGEVDVKFEDSTIKIKYVGELGIPANFTDFQNVVKQLKPAHLNIEFKFKYRRYEELRAYTHAELSAYTHKQIREGVI